MIARTWGDWNSQTLLMVVLYDPYCITQQCHSFIYIKHNWVHIGTKRHMQESLEQLLCWIVSCQLNITLWSPSEMQKRSLGWHFPESHSWYYSGLSFVNESNSQWKVKRTRGPLLTGISLKLVDLDVQLDVWLRASSQGAAGNLTCCCWLRQLVGVFSQTLRSMQLSWGPLTATCLGASGGVSRICFPNFLLHLCLHCLAISLCLSYVSSSATTPAKLSRSLCKF